MDAMVIVLSIVVLAVQVHVREDVLAIVSIHVREHALTLVLEGVLDTAIIHVVADAGVHLVNTTVMKQARESTLAC